MSDAFLSKIKFSMKICFFRYDIEEKAILVRYAPDVPLRSPQDPSIEILGIIKIHDLLTNFKL